MRIILSIPSLAAGAFNIALSVTAFFVE